MSESILDGRNILVVDDEPDVLTVLEEEITHACAGCSVDKATTYEHAAELLNSKRYDAVVLDIMGVRGFDLLEIAVKREFRAAMLTAHALTPEALKRSHDLGARAYLPKDKLGEIVPFLEDMLANGYKAGWSRLVETLEGYFDDEFDPGWKNRSGLAYW
jgi:DNA-binding response OmpR family regulator